MSFLVRHLLDIGWTLLDTEIIGAFFERTHARHHNNRRKTRTYWTLRVKRVYWLDTYMYKTLNVSNALHLSVPQTLKSALLIDTLNVLVFYWAERVRHWDWLVLVGWTLVSQFGPNGLCWFHSFYITSRTVFSHSIRCTTETHGIWLLNTHLFTFMNMWQLL